MNRVVRLMVSFVGLCPRRGTGLVLRPHLIFLEDVNMTVVSWSRCIVGTRCLA